MGLLDNIHKSFDHRIRLGIMSVLVANEEVDFTTLKELLDATDGNLASHVKALEKEGFLAVSKSFINRKPNTKYLITKAGRVAFTAHINALEKLINRGK